MDNEKTIEDICREMDYHCQAIAEVGVEIELNRESGEYPLWKNYDREVAIKVAQSVRRSFELVLWECTMQNMDYRPLQDMFLVQYRILRNVQEILYAATGKNCGLILEKAVVMSVLMLLNNSPPPMIMMALKANYFLNDTLSVDLTGDGRDSDGIASQTAILRLVAQDLTVDEFDLFYNHTAPIFEKRFPLFSETFVFFHCPTTQVSTRAKEAVLLIIRILQSGIEGGQLKSVLPWFVECSLVLFQDLACMWRDFLVWRAECQSSRNFHVEDVCTQSLNDLFAYIGDLLAQAPAMLSRTLLDQLEAFVLRPVFLRPLMLSEGDIPSDRYRIAAPTPAVGLYCVMESLQGISDAAWQKTVASCLLRPLTSPDQICPPPTPQSTIERKKRWAQGFHETSPRRQGSQCEIQYPSPVECLLELFRSGNDDNLIPSVGVVEQLYGELGHNNVMVSLLGVMKERLLCAKPLLDVTVDAILCLLLRAWTTLHQRLVLDTLQEILLGLQKTLVFDEIQDSWDRACKVGRTIPDCFNDFYQNSKFVVSVTPLFIFLRTRRMLVHVMKGTPWGTKDTASLCDVCRLPDGDLPNAFYVMHPTHLILVLPDDQKTLWGRPVVLQPLSKAIRIELVESEHVPVPPVRIDFTQDEQSTAENRNPKQILLYFADTCRASVCYRALTERYERLHEAATAKYRDFMQELISDAFSMAA